MKTASEIEDASLTEYKKRTCPECRGSDLMRDYDLGEIVCISCGYVMDEKIVDKGPEWRAFDDEQIAKRTRAGKPITFAIHDKGLSTTIDWGNNRSIRGRLSSTQKRELYSLRKWERKTWASNSTERNLAMTLSELSKISSALNLPKNIVETASVIYRRVIKKRLIRGRSRRSLIASAIYLSCRQCGVIRTLDEVATVSNLNKVEIARNYRFIVEELDIFVPPSTSRDYAAKFSNKLEVSGRAETMALRIVEIARKMKLTSGRGPIGIAAASTYLAAILADEKRSQKEIAEVANVTEVTIRNRCKELLKTLMIEVDL